ncbi:hypothetical protein DHEL01_v206619 [Diaporthe helianthi]|uniref:Uncharacterized protein n=1 Tax=Diaporthe helianthi TaxID=158607 RepID=A0A2P5HXJ9_DIAHE|nr:hypothetical protein DHEL01_v206619 [Diaporthe helianthi]
MHLITLLTVLTFSAMGVQPGASHDNLEDTAVALKQFEDELAEFQRLGEERWAAGDNEAQVKGEDVQTGVSRSRTAKAARRAERRARAT